MKIKYLAESKEYKENVINWLYKQWGHNYEYGKKVYDKINDMMFPQYEDEEEVNPFDLWEGADFKIRMVGREIPDSKTGQKILVPNYENSEFDRPSDFMDGDEDKLEELIEQTHDLSEFVDPSLLFHCRKEL